MSRTKKYKIDLFTGEGIDDLLNAIEDKKKWLDRKTEELVERLTDYGVVIANAGFMGAAYDGTNDFYVGFEHRGDAHRAVIATGDTVLFVEFGTGVVYPDNHPEAGKNGMVRGAYGLGHGKPGYEVVRVDADGFSAEYVPTPGVKVRRPSFPGGFPGGPGPGGRPPRRQ